MAKAELDSETPREITAADACRVLQRLFPKRVIKENFLTYFKREGIVEPRGRTMSRHRQPCYTLDDVVALAAAMDIADRGVEVRSFTKGLRRIQKGSRKVTECRSGPLVMIYDPGPIAEQVDGLWKRHARSPGDARVRVPREAAKTRKGA